MYCDFDGDSFYNYNYQFHDSLICTLNNMFIIYFNLYLYLKILLLLCFIKSSSRTFHIVIEKFHNTCIYVLEQVLICYTSMSI